LSKSKLQEVLQSSQTKEVTEIIEALAGFPVRKKAPTRIGARMGRPEKANPREMAPPVHVLFPVGFKGGKQRSVGKASKEGSVSVEIVRFECPECHSISFTRKCQKCGAMAEYSKACSSCGQPSQGDRCPKCNSKVGHFTRRELDIKSQLDAALERLGEGMPELVKGVEGMTSEYKIPEPLEKGILRAKHKVYVFKDGTVRFDATDVPLTHFMPRELGTPVERLRELGYAKDSDGKPLESDDQVVELKVQDVILSNSAADYLLNASKFVDDLLQKFYGIPPYYRASSREDLVGHIVLGLAPHTSVGTVGRIIGFTSASVGYAHPFFHAAKRRDCDGDEDCVMLLLDALLNFSKRFLPAGRGGQMDAPLILNTKINPNEIDKQAHHMDIMERYPLEFYQATLSYESPAKILQFMETVEQRLGTEAQYEGLKFSAATSDIAAGPLASKYKTLETMEEKLDAQLGLAEKIRAVDERDVAELVIEHHFIPDLKGNTRKFGAQEFRCVKCNAHYRRIPLKGVCTRPMYGSNPCGNNLLLTVSRGGAEKYLAVAMGVAEKYNVSEYTKQRLMLSQRDIKSTFESDAARQTSLADFL
jgi:DNA polymerase II large subunit